jgi:ElaA protein
MEIIIKPYSDLNVDELHDMLQLRSEVFVVEQTCVYNDLDGWDKHATHIFLYEDELILAYARILPARTKFPQISIGRVVVNPGFRKRDFGKYIMARAVEFAIQEWKAKEIKISAQLYLKKFYEDLGFKTVTDIYDEDGIPHIGMIYLP